MMFDKELHFPDIDISPSDPVDEATDSTAVEAAEVFDEQYAAEQLINSIMESRYIAVENTDIDITQFPAFKTALGFSESENINDSFDIASAEEENAENLSEQESCEQIPEYTEDPIPSIFAGIGRSDWSDFEKSLSSSGQTDVCEEDNSGEENSIPEEPEEDLDELALLDYIDDIEFSGMDAEPLSPIRIIAPSSDPYNSAFNDRSDSEDTDEEEILTINLEHNYNFEKN